MSLLYKAGATPPEVIAQAGHKSAAIALEVYARKMKRERDTGAGMDALVDWAKMGTNGTEEAIDVASLDAEEEREPAL